MFRGENTVYGSKGMLYEVRKDRVTGAIDNCARIVQERMRERQSTARTKDHRFKSG